ncbi:hypothetical protein EOL96_02620 [Candidatus Saccharibacteria bacterium]|nr:hypothetical protein [Candidatus Saccharibacteria bacterium]
MRAAWKHVSNTTKLLYILAAIYSLYLALQYATGDALTMFDAAGHVATLHAIETTWPALTSWQPDQLLGLHYGVMYPPFFHWVSAGLGLLLGTETAFVLLISICLILLPVSLWWYAKSIHLPHYGRAAVILGGLAVLSITPDYFGGNISGLFRLGLTTSFMATPLVLISWSLTEKATRSYHKKWLVLLSLTLGILIWSHLIGAIVAFTYALAAIFVSLLHRRTVNAKHLSVALLLGILLGVPFIVSFMGAYSRSMGVNSGMVSSITLFAFAVIAAISFTYASRAYKQAIMTPVFVSSVFFTFIAGFDALLVRIDVTQSPLYSINAYRFQIFMLLLALVLIIQTLHIVLQNYKIARSTYIVATAIMSAVFVSVMITSNPAKLPDAHVEYTHTGSLDGRFLEAFSRGDSGYVPYTMQTKILQHNPKSQWAYGLFIESEPNAQFIKSLSMSLNPNPSTAVPLFEPEQVIVSNERKEQLLDLFGISHLITLDTNNKDTIGTWRQSGEKKFYHSIARTKPPLAEVPTVPLRAVTADWEGEVLGWWRSSGPIAYIPYRANSGTLRGSVAPTEIDLEQWDTHGITLDIHSNRDTIVLIKASYSPSWRATDASGQQVTLHQVAPNLMALSSHGRVVLQP